MRIYRIMQLVAPYTKMPKDKDHSGKMDTQLFPEVPGWPDFQNRRKRKTKKAKPRGCSRCRNASDTGWRVWAQTSPWDSALGNYVKGIHSVLVANKDLLGVASVDVDTSSHPHYEITCDGGDWKVTFFFDLGDDGNVWFSGDVTGQITEQALVVNKMVNATFPYSIQVDELDWDRSSWKDFLGDWSSSGLGTTTQDMMDEIAESLMAGEGQ